MSTAVVTRRAAIQGVVLAGAFSKAAAPAPLARAPHQVIFPLEERFPGDPGQRSGVAIAVDDFGSDCAVNVIIRFPSQHVMGIVPADAVLDHIVSAYDARQHATIQLCELYPQMSPLRPSGAELHYHPCDGSLLVMMGNHCFGVISGEALAGFVLEVLSRAKRPGPAR